MPKKRSENSGDEKPPEINDLKRIDGIGPAIERHLHKVNIYTYAQLAALSPADIAAAVGISGATSERIIKQDWIGQARKLALETMSGEAQEEVEAPDEPIMPSIVSEIEPSAPVTEITEDPSSVVPEPEAVSSTPQATELGSPVVSPVELSEVEPSAPVTETPADPSSVVSEPEAVSSTPQATEPSSPVVSRSTTMEDQKTPPVVLRTEPVGVARLRQVETIPAGTYTPQNCLPYGQSFDVRLTLDLSDVKIADNTQLSYSVSIYSKNLKEHSRQTIAESDGIIAFTDKATISVGITLLPKGTHRLKAVVILNPMTTELTPQTGLVASKESDLVIIF